MEIPVNIKNLGNGVAVVAIAIAGGLAGGALQQRAHADSTVNATFDTINAKRINLVEDNGKPALVLGSSTTLPNANVFGRPESPRGVPGIIFYNQRGDETGGLIFSASDEGAETVDGGVHLSFDQVNQNQTIFMNTWRNGDFVRTALRVMDRPTDMDIRQTNRPPEYEAYRERMRAAKTDEERERLQREWNILAGEKRYFAERIFLGSEGDGTSTRTAMLEIKDSRSRPRIRLSVDESDRPRIEVLDENGRVVRSLSDEID